MQRPLAAGLAPGTSGSEILRRTKNFREVRLVEKRHHTERDRSHLKCDNFNGLCVFLQTQIVYSMKMGPFARVVFILSKSVFGHESLNIQLFLLINVKIFQQKEKYLLCVFNITV